MHFSGQMLWARHDRLVEMKEAANRGGHRDYIGLRRRPQALLSSRSAGAIDLETT
jgi:hypothetical protein